MIENFSPGDRVVCILNNRASLTVGKEYVIQSEDPYHDPESDYIDVVADNGELISYRRERFMSLSRFRDLKINQVNNHIKKTQDDNS
jgi:hypothetical protein